jgi:hypothetical protein
MAMGSAEATILQNIVGSFSLPRVGQGVMKVALRDTVI